MWPLPVEELFFVGRATEKRLKALGIETIGDLACMDVGVLRSVLKKHGEVIWNFANGRGASVIEAEPPANKGYGNSTTIAFDVTDQDTAKLVLLSLAETLGRRLRRDGVKIEEVSVHIRFFDLTDASHQKTLLCATNITSEIHEAAAELFDELWDGTPIRHLGIHTGKVRGADCGRQLSLFDGMDYERQEKLDAAVDAIRLRYGADAIKRASFLAARQGGARDKRRMIDHMGGGISREKRTVNYERERVE